MGLVAYLKRQNFYPGIPGLFINPFFFARRDLVKNILQCAPYLKGEILDVGCGKKPYKSLFTRATRYVGMDVENPAHDHSREDIDVFYDGKIFPFPDHSFDSVLTNQVFEHVFNPGEFMSEINRVLKPGGNLLLTVPFMWDEHEQPFDFGRYTSFGIRRILEDHGFTISLQYKSCTGISALFQLWNLYVYKKFYSKNRVANLLLTIIFISPFALVGAIFSIKKAGDSDLFLDNVVLAKKGIDIHDNQSGFPRIPPIFS